MSDTETTEDGWITTFWFDRGYDAESAADIYVDGVSDSSHHEVERSIYDNRIEVVVRKREDKEFEKRIEGIDSKLDAALLVMEQLRGRSASVPEVPVSGALYASEGRLWYYNGCEWRRIDELLEER